MRAAKVVLFSLAFAAAGWAQDRKAVQEERRRPEGFELVKLVMVPGNVSWTEAGIDVRAGEEFYFEATGTVSLQKDNPIAGCGPEGLKLKTLHQPLPDRNLGCLVGRVVVKVEVVEDKETGEKTTRDYGEVFYVGAVALVTMPADGRLAFGANENIAGDNDGAFAVTIYRRKT
jgi:hypothetical protein